jgi:hypothetical protein
MSFLAPLFLLGVLAVAGPVIFHLIRRTTREKQTFSSLMFLQSTPPRVTKRSRLEHILLLALRCLILCLLAAGFARPFFSKPVIGDEDAAATRRTVVLLDTSASLRREGVWEAALDRARQTVRAAGVQDHVAVFAFDRDVRRLVTLEEWSSMAAGERAALAVRRLDSLQPGWQATHLDKALLAAVEALEEAEARQNGRGTGAREIVLITDLQGGSRTDALQAFEWPARVAVRIEQVKARRTTNAGLQLVADEALDGEGEAAPRVRVSNAADAASEQFQIGWARPDGEGFLGEPVRVYVPPGQSRVFALPGTPTGLPEERLRLAGDDESFDNLIHVVPPTAAEVHIAYLGNEDATDTKGSLFYLHRAFPETRRQRITVQAHRLDTDVPASALAQAGLIVLAGKPSEKTLASLRDSLDAGAHVLFALPSTDAAPVLARLAGVVTVRCEEARVAQYALLGQVDFEHPLFKPFADPRYSDFAKIVFWKHRRLELDDLPGARALARFDSGDPALIQMAVGKGTLLVLAAGWHPADSQLALSTKFVPLLHSLLAFSGHASVASTRLHVGDPIRFSDDATQRATVRKPDGTTVEVAGGGAFYGTDQPGIYAITTTAGAQRFALNLDAAESRTAPLPTEELERLRVPLKMDERAVAASLAARQQLLNSELEQQQKLWRWLIVVALLVLMLETWLSGRLTKQPASA